MRSSTFRRRLSHRGLWVAFFLLFVLNALIAYHASVFPKPGLVLSTAWLISILLFALFWRMSGDMQAYVTLEEDSKKAERFLSSIVENIPDMIFVKDALDFRFVRFNKAGEDLLGYSREQLLGKNDHDFFPKDQADFFVSKDRAVIEGRKLVDIPEEPIQTREKGQRFLHTKKIPITDDQGFPRYLLGISEDVTERKQSEEKIRQLNQALAQRADDLEAVNRELEAFSYSVSHDLRAPLRHISGFANLLSQDDEKNLSPEGRRHLQVIIRAVRDMGQLIDDLLSFSRMSRVELMKSSVDLEAVTKKVIKDNAASFDGRVIRWKIGRLPVVHSDPAMIQLAILNLISNAVKYTRQRPEALIEIGSLPEEKENVIFVRDNGVGFDPRYVHKLFGVFQRLHTNREFEGTGIGLANVRRIINRHGGRVWAEGEPDEGATFYFSLPR